MSENQVSLNRVILGPEEIDKKIKRIALEILERHPQGPLALIGIHTRGVILARRVEKILSAHLAPLSFGSIDIALYRDDLDNLRNLPSIHGSDIPFSMEGINIILFDDVLFTGRTTRAALNVLMDYGRPHCIELAVLVDRGNRELPIRADYIGEALRTTREEHVRVHFREIDSEDGVIQMIGDPA